MRLASDKIVNYLANHPNIFINDPAYQLNTLRYAPEMSGVIWEVKRALKKGVNPEKCKHGTSGTYLLKDEEEMPIALFKREAYLKEYAAYRLDYEHFAGVPPTVITTLSHPVWGGLATGSCQLFIEDAIPAVEMSRNEYQKLSPQTVRKVAQLDIRILNLDRNASNILIFNSEDIIPVDHGLSFPNELGGIYLEWMHWHQSATPFSEEENGYISSLDPEKDRAFLIEEMGFKEKIGNRLYVSTMLLKIGASQGLYPNQLGDIVSKTYQRKAPQSQFELLINRLLNRQAQDWTTFTKYVNEELENILGEYEANQYKNLPIFSRISRDINYNSQ